MRLAMMIVVCLLTLNAMAAAEDAPATRPAATRPVAPAAPVAPENDEAVRARLAAPVPRLQFENLRLADAFDFLHRITRITIAVDWDALADAGVRRDHPVTARGGDVSLAVLLDGLLGGLPARVSYAVEGGGLTISTVDKIVARHGVAPASQPASGR